MLVLAIPDKINATGSVIRFGIILYFHQILSLNSSSRVLEKISNFAWIYAGK